MSKKDQDKKILKLRKRLLAKEALLGQSEKPTYITGGMFRTSAHSDRGAINIKTAAVDQIRQAAQSVVIQTEADKLLGLDSTTHLGYSLDSWIQDFKTRLTVLAHITILADVKAIREKVDAELLSTSQKRDIVLDETLAKADKLTEN
jgi:hypothetical protein